MRQPPNPDGPPLSPELSDGSLDVVRRPSVAALLLGLIPFVAMCFSVSLWDRVHPMVLELPFNLFWLLAWIVLTPVCLRIAYLVETSRSREASSSAPDRNGAR
jgi:uncharacterized protein DUF3311